MTKGNQVVANVPPHMRILTRKAQSKKPNTYPTLPDTRHIIPNTKPNEQPALPIPDIPSSSIAPKPHIKSLDFLVTQALKQPPFPGQADFYHPLSLAISLKSSEIRRNAYKASNQPFHKKPLTLGFRKAENEHPTLKYHWNE
jgi:hypothetical protein